MNPPYFHRKRIGNVENKSNSPVTIRFVAKTSDISLKTSDLAKAVLRETNHGCTVVSHRCSCWTLIVSRQWPLLQYNTRHRAKCRTEAASAVSRNLQNAKNHFIEAKIYKNIRVSDTTPNYLSTSTRLCVTSNMKSSSHKTCQTSITGLRSSR